MINLPSELQNLIINNLAYPDDINLSSTCKHWGTRWGDKIWRDKCKTFSKHCYTSSGTWMKLYHNLYNCNGIQLYEIITEWDYRQYTYIFLPSGIMFKWRNNKLWAVPKLKSALDSSTERDVEYPIYNPRLLTYISREKSEVDKIRGISPKQLLVKIDNSDLSGIATYSAWYIYYHQGIEEIKQLVAANERLKNGII